jgi:hypothetical protein
MNFHFRLEDSNVRTHLLFAKIDSIFELDFMTGEVNIVYKIQTPLKAQPQFFKMNDD